MGKVAIEESGSVLKIVLGDANRNSLDKTTLETLLEAFQSVPKRKGIRAIILTNSDEAKTFCSGLDLNWAFEAKKDELKLLPKIINEMQQLNVPIIGRVTKPVYGGGVGLLCATDFCLSSGEKFGIMLPEVKRGILPAIVSTNIVQKVGIKNAMELMCFGKFYNGANCERLGIVNRHFRCELDMDKEIHQLVANLNQCCPRSVGMTKNLIQTAHRLGATLGVDQAKVGDLMADVLFDSLKSDEGKEGIKAFLEKRKPSWAKADE